MNEVWIWILAGVFAVGAQLIAFEAGRKWRQARRRCRIARQRSPERRLAGITEQTVAAMIHEARAAFERSQRRP